MEVLRELPWVRVLHCAGHLPPFPAPLFPKLSSCPFCFLSSCSLFSSHFLSSLSFLSVFVRHSVPKEPICQWQMLLCSDTVHLVLTLQSPAFPRALAPLAFTGAAWPCSGCPDSVSWWLQFPNQTGCVLTVRLFPLSSHLGCGRAPHCHSPCRPHPDALFGCYGSGHMALLWREAHSYQNPGSRNYASRSAAQTFPRVGAWPGHSAVVASPTLCQEGRREKGIGKEKGRSGMGKREKWSPKEGENRTHTPLPHSLRAPAGPHQALARVPGPGGDPHQTPKERCQWDQHKGGDPPTMGQRLPGVAAEHCLEFN